MDVQVVGLGLRLLEGALKEVNHINAADPVPWKGSGPVVRQKTVKCLEIRPKSGCLFVTQIRDPELVRYGLKG
jgi:hypothetical protein